MKSTVTLSAAVTLLLGTTNAFWRMPCHERTGLMRIDPIVDLGVASQHGHALHGGNNLGLSTSYKDLRASECTSCQFADDKSAYWTPSLHFIHENGTTQVAPQVGGMLAYYLLFGDNIKAFPAGFQMLAGDTRQRNFSGPVPDPPLAKWQAADKTQLALAQKAIGMNCMNYNKPPEGSRFRHFLPTKDYMDANCIHGIRAELMFPSCWNGKDLDTDDHKSHMAYPDSIDGGSCPPGFDVRLPTLFFETIWNTYVFEGLPGQYVFANGDPTGYGYHGDFINGWDIPLLTNAVNDCRNPSGRVEDCKYFTPKLQTEQQQSNCKITKIPDILAKDNCDGPTNGLCGNVLVQQGPGYADDFEVGKHGSESTLSPPPAIAGPAATPPPAASKPATTPPAPPGNPAPPAPKAVAVAIAAACPVVTPAAHLNDAADGSISTMAYTKDGVVYEIVIKDVVKTTVVENQYKKAPRRTHHYARDRAYGVWGRH